MNTHYMPLVLGLVLTLVASLSLASDNINVTTGFDCIITPSQSVELGSPVAGQLSQVLVDRSSRVTTGQTVASIESRLEEATLNIANFRAGIESELGYRMAAYKIDQRAEERIFSLVQTDIATQQDKDRASRDVKMAAWRVLQAEENIRVSRLEKIRAEIALERRNIVSPIDGVVVKRYHSAGENIDSQPILRIVKLDPLHVEAILPMQLFGKLKPGMSTKVISDNNPTVELEAIVDVVDPMGDAGSGTFGARLVLANPEGAIAAGVKCRVQIEADRHAAID